MNAKIDKLNELLQLPHLLLHCPNLTLHRFIKEAVNLSFEERCHRFREEVWGTLCKEQMLGYSQIDHGYENEILIYIDETEDCLIEIHHLFSGNKKENDELLTFIADQNEKRNHSQIMVDDGVVQLCFAELFCESYIPQIEELKTHELV
jgi:hypothetical protein